MFFFSLHFVRLRTKTRRHQQEHQYMGISMTISIDAKCYYVLVFIRSRSTCMGTAVSRNMVFGYHKRSILLR